MYRMSCNFKGDNVQQEVRAAFGLSGLQPEVGDISRHKAALDPG